MWVGGCVGLGMDWSSSCVFTPALLLGRAKNVSWIIF